MLNVVSSFDCNQMCDKRSGADGQFPGLCTGYTFTVKLTVHIFSRLFDRVNTGWVSDDFHVFSTTVFVSMFFFEF